MIPNCTTRGGDLSKVGGLLAFAERVHARIAIEEQERAIERKAPEGSECGWDCDAVNFGLRECIAHGDESALCKPCTNVVDRNLGYCGPSPSSAQVRPKRARYLRRRSASLLRGACACADAANSVRPASESDLRGGADAEHLGELDAVEAVERGERVGAEVACEQVVVAVGSRARGAARTRCRRSISSRTSRHVMRPPSASVAMRITAALKSRKLPGHVASATWRSAGSARAPPG